MQKIFLVLFLSVFAFADETALEKPKLQCQQYESTHLQKKVRYCTYRSRPEEKQDGEIVLYFFHGMMGDAESAEPYLAMIDKLATEENFPAVTLISFDTSEQSFFSDYEGKMTGPYAYETWFLTEFVPLMESTYPICHERHCRGTIGLSMGGLGAMKTALKRADLFAATAVSCPALGPFSIFESDEKWDKYFGRHPIGKLIGSQLLASVRKTFPTEEIFAANNPVDLVEDFADAQDFPALYFQVGGKDEFGFQEGAEVLKQTLEQRGFTYQYDFIPDATHSINQTHGIDALRFLAKNLRP